MKEKTEYRSAAWESEQDGHISGYAVVFNSRTVLYKDQETGIEYGEIIDPHALDNADLRDVVLRVDHEGSVLARTRNHSLTLTVDSYGLKVDADLSGSQESRNLYESIKNGLYDKMSFAFVVADKGDSYDNNTRTRTIRSIERLYDVAVVTFPAYEQTSVSARAKYTGYAEEDRNDFYRAENRKALDSIDVIFRKHGISIEHPEYYADDGIFELSEREQIYNQMFAIRERCATQAQENRSLIGSEPIEQLRSLENKLIDMKRVEMERRAAVTLGEGKIIKTFDEKRGFYERKIKPMSEIRNNFYSDMVEKRAAGTTAMSTVIPTEIFDHAFRTGNNGLLPLVSLTHIEHGGNIKIPYLSDTSAIAGTHVENAAILVDDYVPRTVLIDHREYQKTLGYSYLGMTIAVQDLQNIIENALIGGMNVTLDGVAIGAVDGLTWVTTGTGANAVNWETADNPKLSEIIALMKLLPAQYSNNAKFIMNKATVLSIIENSTGNVDASTSNGMYNVSVIDGLTRIFGVPVVEDSNVSTGVIYYGNPSAVHFNIAGDVDFDNWRDRDSLTEKFQVACAAGAGCEVGAFVRGSNS